MTDDTRARSEDIDWEETSHGKDIEFRRKRLGAAAGSDELGCSLYEVPPGKRTWPYHYHAANEEAIFVLDGKGELRTPEGTSELSAGDYVAAPTGEDGAHRVAAADDAEKPLRYLSLSTMCEPDVLVYPDSGKVGVYTGSAPGGSEAERTTAKFFPADADVDFWEGEE